MAGTTPNLGLYLPGGGSTGTWTPDEVADVDPINQNFLKVDAFAGQVGVQANRNQQYYGPAAAISSVIGMKKGDEYQESDGSGILWRYDGANWITYEAGLWVIRPVSVGNGNVQADGAIVPTAQGTMAVNGVFTPRFRKYRIEFFFSTLVNVTPQLRLRNAGVDYAAATYNYQTMHASGGVAQAAVGTTQTLWNLAMMGGSHHSGHFDLTAPAINGAVKMLEADINTASPATNGVGQSHITGHNTLEAAAYDGFAFFVSGSVFNGGAFKVYGLM